MLSDLNRIAREFATKPAIAANATITFTRISESPGMTEDDYGNPIPLPSTETTVILECYLNEKPMPRMMMMEGVDENCAYLQGRLTNPKTYPFPLNSQSEITVTVGGRTGTAITEIRAIPSPSSEQYGIKNVLGQRIAMTVQFKQGN